MRDGTVHVHYSLTFMRVSPILVQDPITKLHRQPLVEHFSIIRALARAALAVPNPAARRQVERLRDAALKDGDLNEAAGLDQILAADPRMAEMAPSRIVRSAATLQKGELLTDNTSIPVDRETATPLAQITFPKDCPVNPPILEESLNSAVLGIIEEWQHAGELLDAGIAPLQTLLLYGPPGTGKTHLALWMAKELNLPVVLARLDGLVSSFLGTTSRNIGSLFSFAARYKCVLLLDEFDALAKLRDDPHEMGEIKRVVNTLLQNLDSRSKLGLSIGITNHEQLLDPAIWRRFEAQLSLPRPCFSARLSIVRHFMRSQETNESATRLLAWCTEGASGADIEQLCLSLQKRMLIAKASGTSMPLLQTLQAFLSIHAGRIEANRMKQLEMPIENLVVSLLADRSLGLSRSDMAELVGRDPTTISRWIQRSSVKAMTTLGGSDA